MDPKIVALVPMRHHSARVPRKNYRPLAGEPLFHHILTTLEKVPEIESVLVDTDSSVIMEGILKHFPGVKTISRPAYLLGEMVSMNDILIYDTSIIDADYYLQTHSTNPLIKSETISRAIQTFLAEVPDHDSLFGVTRLQTRLWDQDGKPINHDPNVLLRTQDLPPTYEENSCIYIFSRERLIARQNRIGERPLMFEIPAVEAWDIDEELDFSVVEILYRQSHGEIG